MTYATYLRNELAQKQAEKKALDAKIREVFNNAVNLETIARVSEETWADLHELEREIRNLERDLKSETAEQGTPATYAVGSDRYAGQVARVQRFKSGKNEGKVSIITFQFADTTGGLSRRLNDFRKNKQGYWKAVDSSATLHIGYAEDYRDPNF